MDNEQQFQPLGKFGHDFFSAKISGALVIVDAFQLIEETFVRHVPGQPETSVLTQATVRFEEDASIKIPDCFRNALGFVSRLLRAQLKRKTAQQRDCDK